MLLVQLNGNLILFENKNLFDLISKDKKIMSIISEKKLKSIFNYSGHFIHSLQLLLNPSI